MRVFGLTSADFKQMLRIYRMNLRARYLGSRIGFAWAILNPLLQTLTYVVVFGFVLRITLPGSSPLDYVIWFICGFSPWMAFSDGVNSTAASVISNAKLLKTFPMKSEIMPIAAALMGLPQLLVGLLLVTVLCLGTGLGLSLHLLWLLLVVPLLFAFLAGVGFFLAAITVFVRDILQIIGTFLLLLMYFSPVMYEVAQLPWILPQISFFNPIYQIVDPFRRVFIQQAAPNFAGLLYLAALVLLLWVFGLMFFRRMKGLFESVL